MRRRARTSRRAQSRLLTRRSPRKLIRRSDSIPFDVNQMRTVVIDTSYIYTLVPRIATYQTEISSQIRRALDNADAVDANFQLFSRIARRRRLTVRICTIVYAQAFDSGAVVVGVEQVVELGAARPHQPGHAGLGDPCLTPAPPPCAKPRSCDLATPGRPHGTFAARPCRRGMRSAPCRR